MSIPATHRALTVISKGKASVQEKPLPPYTEDNVLVKVKAVALNPTDWKHIDFLLRPNASVGCDFAGDVVFVGEKAKTVPGHEWKVGDKVAGFIRGGYSKEGIKEEADNGAFQEYVSVLPQSIWRKPDSLPYEDAAAMGGIALSTAAQALFHRLKLSPPWEPTSTPEPFFVWGGSTGVGMYAVKLASLSGYKVVATASPRNFELVKSLGAAAVFDYRDPQTPEKVAAWVKEEFGDSSYLKRGLDTISEGSGEDNSTKRSVGAFAGEGELITLLPPPKDLQTSVKVTDILVYSALKPRNADDFNNMAEWYRRLPGLVESGKIGAGVVPLKRGEGGLDGLEEALAQYRAGKVSGEKVVLSLNE